jgi:hypothetical protein
MMPILNRALADARASDTRYMLAAQSHVLNQAEQLVGLVDY